MTEPDGARWLIDEVDGQYVPFQLGFGYGNIDPRFLTFDAARYHVESQGGVLL